MVSPSGDERILAFVGRGDIVGELSLIDGLPRSASVVAVRDATLSCLSRTAFETFAKKHPAVTPLRTRRNLSIKLSCNCRAVLELPTFQVERAHMIAPSRGLASRRTLKINPQ
jgi:signal-transduction protein with cAMP-binding, CBS, and nucleotidyltransferase domain